MEPLAALELASNLVALVEFSLKTVAKCHEFYHDGVAIEQQDFQNTAVALGTATDQLRASVEDIRTTRPLTKDEVELVQLAKECNAASENLTGELQKLGTSTPGNFRKALSQTVKSTFRAGPIKTLRTKMLSYQDALNTRILVGLHDQANFVVREQQEHFQKLDKNQQYIITRLAEGFSKIEDLVRSDFERVDRHVVEQGKMTRDHLSDAVQSLQSKDHYRTLRDAFLKSLLFPEIHFRQQMIRDAYKDTFDFIFDESGKTIQPWSNFVEWLNGKEGIYWIYGKAGSGKSTLMNFIIGDARTKQNLVSVGGSGPRDCLICTFFFWIAGSPMQKSARGLLQSLMYQIFSQDEALFALICTTPEVLEAGPHTVWSLRVLITLLKTTVANLSSPICFFLDGLDEFDEGSLELLELVNVLKVCPNTKICLSSRPSQVFEDVFRDSPKLRLEELTRPSIRSYVEAKLLENTMAKSLAHESPHEARRLMELILEKAQGVFLWVHLVVQDLLTGVTSRDDWEELSRRLERTPDEVSGIYTRMWEKHFKDSKIYEDPELCFWLLIEDEMSLLSFTVAFDPEIHRVYLEAGSRMKDIDILDRCEITKARYTARCGGLIEVSDGYNSFPPVLGPSLHDDRIEVEKSSLVGLHLTTRVQFLHRTARDFVLGKLQELDENGQSLDHVKLFFVRVRARLVLWLLDPFLEMFCILAEFDALRDLHELLKVDAGTTVQHHTIDSALYQALSMLQDVCAIMEKERGPKEGQWWYEGCSVAMDFRGAVVEAGFGDYDGTLRTIMAQQDSKYLSYILCCACVGLREDWHYRSEILSVIRILLENDTVTMANTPLSTTHNKGHSAFTAWHLLLQSCWTQWLNGATEAELAQTLEPWLRSKVDMNHALPFLILIDSSGKIASEKLNRSLSKRRLVVMANPSSILRLILADEPGLRNFVEFTYVFEIILSVSSFQDYRGYFWHRLSSPDDSEYLFKAIRDSRAARMIKIAGLPAERAMFDDYELDSSILGAWQELLNRLKEVETRSLSYEDDANAEKLKIPGWTTQLAQKMLWTLSDSTYEDCIADWDVPEMLFEGLEIDQQKLELKRVEARRWRTERHNQAMQDWIARRPVTNMEGCVQASNDPL